MMPLVRRTDRDSFTDNTVLAGIFACVILIIGLTAAPASAQVRRSVIFGEIGGVSIGHADSQQGKAPIFGGGAAFHLTPRVVIEGDVLGGRVQHVFGRADHTFSQITMTGSLLFRSARGPIHFVGGGGLAVQRAHSEFEVQPVGLVDRVETVRLLHGRIGADWETSDRIVIRMDGALWMGGGLDWILGGRVGLGYRF